MRRSSIKLSSDINKRALEIVRLSTEESQEEIPVKKEKPKKKKLSPISEYLAEIGRRGGLKGGKARATKLSVERRKEIASIAATTRWQKLKDKEEK